MAAIVRDLVFRTVFSCAQHFLLRSPCSIVHGGSGDEGNNDCSPEEEIPAGVSTTVRIDIRQTHVEVYYNGQMRCTEPRSHPHAWSPVHMYMADPWHTTALAEISDFYLEHLDPITGCTDELACNYDDRAAIDDKSCRVPARGTDCNGRSIGNADGSGVTRFVSGQVALSNDPGRSFHAVVTVPLDYILSLTITPSNQLATEWSGIFHITATGNNCCEYGDRIPGMWFAPNSRRLTVAGMLSQTYGSLPTVILHIHIVPCVYLRRSAVKRKRLLGS
jgi:hypothetical protein